jgi:dGTPase
LKVAQFGRRLAEKMLRETRREDVRAVGGIDPDVVEAAALAHDLGHPPFGHIAEDELNRQVRNTAEVDDGFEGNAQSFRIVTKVAIRSDEFSGLNLTRATLNATLKYPWSRGPAGKESRKWGYYYSERADFLFARGGDEADRRRSTEAELMDWADDVTYAVHDVEDFYRAGIIPLDQIMNDTGEREFFLDQYASDWGKRVPDVDTRRRADEFLNALALLQPPRGWRPFIGSVDQRAYLDRFASQLITRYIGGPRLNPGGKRSRVTIPEQFRFEVDVLKGLMRTYVFDHSALLAQQHGERRVIRELFEILFDAAAPKSPRRGIIPMPFKDVCGIIDSRQLDEPNDRRERARLVADTISHMTEQQAVAFHQRLVGISAGSVLDVIVR